ncbi:MAG TPA: hypothetical protein VH593_14425 [Ktedonobacteraceae bacterium]|jgi:hypothetical protein
MDTPSEQFNEPDFGVPDFAVPALKHGDLSTPGIALDVFGEFDADPAVPNLTEYGQPDGLDIHNLQGDGPTMFRPDPLLNDLLDYDVPGDASVQHDPTMPDLLVPDFQHPQLTPDIKMTGRPGDLAPGALDVMHEQPTYQQLDDVPYSQVFMDQTGMNTTRRRHMDLLMHGLDEVGQ